APGSPHYGDRASAQGGSRMKFGIVVIGTGLLLGIAGSGGARVNRKQVDKYLTTGRSVQDGAETMLIDQKDVKKCQDEAACEPKAGDAQGGGGDMKGGREGAKWRSLRAGGFAPPADLPPGAGECSQPPPMPTSIGAGCGWRSTRRKRRVRAG